MSIDAGHHASKAQIDHCMGQTSGMRGVALDYRTVAAAWCQAKRQLIRWGDAIRAPVKIPLRLLDFPLDSETQGEESESSERQGAARRSGQKQSGRRFDRY